MKTIEINGNEIACDQVAEVSLIEEVPWFNYSEFSVTTKYGKEYGFSSYDNSQEALDDINDQRNKPIEAMRGA